MIQPEVSRIRLQEKASRRFATSITLCSPHESWRGLRPQPKQVGRFAEICCADFGEVGLHLVGLKMMRCQKSSQEYSTLNVC